MCRIAGVCTLDTLRTLLLADREPWVDKRVTKVAALLFRMSHHCKATLWPVCCGEGLSNMMKHIFNLKLTVSGSSSELRTCSIKHETSFLYYCMNFRLKPIFPGAISADIISVEGTMI